MREALVSAILLSAGAAFFAWLGYLTKLHYAPPMPNLQWDLSMTFTVLQYNLFGQPLPSDGPLQHGFGFSERLKQVPLIVDAVDKGLLEGLDVLTFAEGYDDLARVELLLELQKINFNHSTSVVASTGRTSNGGVFIVSRWPIQREAQHVFSNCLWDECKIAKGVKYARIIKSQGPTQKIFNVFATHLQTSSVAAARKTRMSQALEFVSNLGIPEREPVIFAGTLNSDSTSRPEALEAIAQSIGAHLPRTVGEQKFTVDPHLNVLVGAAGGAGTKGGCWETYKDSWGHKTGSVYHPTGHTKVQCGSLPSRTTVNGDGEAPCGEGSNVPCPYVAKSSWFRLPWTTTENCFCPCCPSERLDHILWGAGPAQQPARPPTVEIKAVQAPAEFVAPWEAIADGKVVTNITLKYPSAHLPILAKFLFKIDKRQQVTRLDGCTQTSDCHLRWFRCYCDGEGCYYNNTPTVGTLFDSSHPINRLCIFSTTECVCGPQ